MAKITNQNIKYTDDNDIVRIQYNPNDGSWQLDIIAANKPDFISFVNAICDVGNFIKSEFEDNNISNIQQPEDYLVESEPEIIADEVNKQIDAQDLLKNLDSNTLNTLISLFGVKQLPEVNINESIAQPVRNIQDIPDEELLEFDSDGWLVPKYDKKGQMILCGKKYMEFDANGVPKFHQPQPIEFKYIKTETNKNIPKHKVYAEKVKTQNGQEIVTAKQAKKIGWS